MNDKDTKYDYLHQLATLPAHGYHKQQQFITQISQQKTDNSNIHVFFLQPNKHYIILIHLFLIQQTIWKISKIQMVKITIMCNIIAHCSLKESDDFQQKT